ncbi:MAG TPA: cell division protein SepF [Actinocrinis sp.]|nr:cell division protein SepF [Actinocrinis sp.]
MPGFIKKTAVYLGLSEGEDPYAYEEYEEEFDQESARPAPAEPEPYEESGRFPAEPEARPLFLGEPRRAAEPERAVPERAAHQTATSTGHDRVDRSAPVREPVPAREPVSRRDEDYARLAPIALVSERTDRPDRYERTPERPLAVATVAARPMAFDGGGSGTGSGSGGAGSSAEAYRITTLHPRTYNEARTIGEHFRDGTPVIMNLTEMSDGDAKRLVDFAAGLVFGLRGSIERVTQRVFLLSPANVDVTAEDKARIAEGGFFNQS